MMNCFHLGSSKASAMVKMSLSPRPHRFARIMLSSGICFARSATAAMAWDGSSAETLVTHLEGSSAVVNLAGENIGAGDVEHFDTAPRWQSAAAKGLATDFIDRLPLGYETQLGRWFKDGQELSGGQGEKLALSRAFMRTEADILVTSCPACMIQLAWGIRKHGLKTRVFHISEMTAYKESVTA